MDETERLVVEAIQSNKQVIVFAASRASAEKTAEDVAKLISFQLPLLEREVLSAASMPTKQCRRLSHCVRKGVAFHHAGLLARQRELIEGEFRKGSIKVICATPTLAAGLSLPVFRVVLKSLKRFSDRWGMDWIPVLEYLQMSGRAGRPEYEKWGEAISIAKDEGERDEIYERYICGQPEEIYSKLAVEPVLRTYLLSLIATGIIRDEVSMRDFFVKTFWAYQFKDMKKLESILQRMLGLLVEWGFVVQPDVKGVMRDFTTADSLSSGLRATSLGHRVSELYLDPLTANHLLRSLKNYRPSHNAFSLLQSISHTLEMRPLLRVKARESWVQEELVQRQGRLLENEPGYFDPEYDDFLGSLKTALFFESWIEEKDDDFLMERYDIRPGEVRVKLEIADWLVYAIGELGRVVQSSAVKDLQKLRVRLKHGVKEELLPLLRLRGIGRVRARTMHRAGIVDLGDVKKVDVVTLGQLIGKAVAEDVKKQVGEEVVEVPAGRRKGQVSLERF